jgi:hypothetical protein
MKRLMVLICVVLAAGLAGCYGPEEKAKHAEWARQLCKGNGGIQYSQPETFSQSAFVLCRDGLKTYGEGQNVAANSTPTNKQED